MSHRHHYGKDFGEPAIAVILVVGGVLVLAMCRICCGQARKEKRERKRQNRRRRRYDIRTHHLVLRMPGHVESIEGRQVPTTTAPLEFTASAPSYSVVVQKPSMFARAPAARPAALARPETPPPPYGAALALAPYVAVERDDGKDKVMIIQEEWDDKSVTNV